MDNPVVGFLRERQRKPQPWKARVENDPHIARMVRDILERAEVRMLSRLSDSIRPKGPYFAENYIRPIAKTRALAESRHPAAVRRTLRAYLSQFQALQAQDVHRGQRLLQALGESRDLIRSRTDLVSHCPSCDALSASSNRSPAVARCRCLSTPWLLRSFIPRKVLADLFRDDLYLELMVSSVLRERSSVVTAPTDHGPASCSIAYRSSLRDVELDIVGYNETTTLIFEARTKRVTANDVTQKRGQILELLQELGDSHSQGLAAIRLVFVSPIPHDTSIDANSYARLSVVPVNFLTGAAVDSLANEMIALTTSRN